MKILYIGNKLATQGKTPTSIETLGVKLEEIAIVYRYSDKKNQVYRLFDILRACWLNRKRVDFAIIDTYSTIAFYYAWGSALLLKILGVSYIPILHGGNLPHRLLRSPRLCHQLFGNSLINVAPSGYLLDHFLRAGLNVTLIPNYIELNQYTYKHRKQASPRILWVRSFHEIYRPHWAIGILERLLKQYPEAHLCMVGPDKDGSLNRCKSLANSKGLTNKIHFTGKLSKHDWIDLSSQYDIFLNTTSIDNTPVSIMEAMALGLIVITTDVGGIPWLFENNVEGILVDNPDEDRLAYAIAEIISQPERTSKLSHNARKKAKEWDWITVKQKWYSLLTENQKHV